MSLSVFVVVLCLSLTMGEDVDIPMEEGVMVLGGDNFQAALDANSMVLVEFYAPWCGHCKKLAPEYAAAATTLAEKNSAAKLAKVDATEHKELGQQFGVKGYPTLKFFKNGVPQEYNGGRTADTIVQWLDKKSGPAAKTLATKDEANAFVSDNKVAVIGFFKDPTAKEAVAFATAADANEEVNFAVTSNSDVFSLFEVTSDAAVVLLKKFDEGRNNIEGDITVETVTDFVNANALPLVVDFNTDTAKQIFQGSVKNHFIMFQSASTDKFEHNLHNARKVAKDFKGDIMFVSVTTDEEEHKRVVEFFGISEDEVPTFRMTASVEDMIKYKPDDAQLSEENIRAFIKSFKDGEVKPHLKSEELPEDWNAAPVKVLASSNFAEVALDASKDVLVEFYAPWCGHCKKLAPIWDELGETFKDNDKIVIAKIDMTANELESVKVRGFPTIKLFKAGDNSAVDYAGGRTLEDFVKFLTPEAEAEATKDELPAQLSSVTMDAIKKKMQAMKVEKDKAMDRGDVCEQAAKDAKVRAAKAEEEVAELVKKAQQLEVELDKTQEELLTTTEKLKEKENSLSSAELEVNALNRRVQSIEGDLETCEDKLLLATNKLDKAATAADDSDCMRNLLESRAQQDEERMGKLEEELKGARNQAEDADKKYDKVAKRLQQVEGELERAEERAEVGEIKIVELEEELRVVANNLKSLEVSEEKANQREASYKEQIKTLSAKLKQAEARAEFSERSVQKLQTEVDRLEDELVGEQEKYKAITEELEQTFAEMSGY